MATTAKTKEKENTTQSSNQMLIGKIKLEKDNTAYIEYSNSDDVSRSTVNFSGKQEVTNKFVEAFQKNKDTLVAIVPFLEKVNANDIVINSLSFKYDSNEKLENVLISSKVTLQKGIRSPLNISTPLIPCYREHFDENTFCVSGKNEEIAHETISLAKDYLKGDTRTNQLSLVIDNVDK